MYKQMASAMNAHKRLNAPMYKLCLTGRSKFKLACGVSSDKDGYAVIGLHRGITIKSREVT